MLPVNAMTDAVIRELRAADIPALTRLWAETFGDGDALIADFFRLLPDMGTGFLAEEGGRLLGAAYLLTGQELVRPDGTRALCGYLYAVAVDPAARGRGLGRALSRACAEEAKKRGCALFCTQPAEPSLFAWYAEILGLDCALRRRLQRLPAAPGDFSMPLSPTDYRFWRERMLSGQPYIRLGDAALRFQHSLCRHNGGGLYAVGDGVAAAYREGESCVVRELLCPPEADRAALAASLAAELGAREALLCTADPEGEPYIAAAAGSLPPDCQWNLSFD